MKKWWKIILGILLIAAAACAMYYWNAQGRRQLEQAKQQASEITEIELIKDPKIEMYEKGYSYFPIPTSWIAVKSIKLAAGDWVGIYYKYPEYENLVFPEAEFESEADDESEMDDKSDIDEAKNSKKNKNKKNVSETDEESDNEQDEDFEYDYDFYENGYEKYDLERIGSYEVSYIDENVVEIICNVEDFKDLENKLAGDYGKLFMVMEAKSE